MMAIFPYHFDQRIDFFSFSGKKLVPFSLRSAADHGRPPDGIGEPLFGFLAKPVIIDI